jgi:hypothetical protein
MKDDLAVDEPDYGPEIPSHAHPEWIMSLDGHRLIDRPRNLREWVRQCIFRRPRKPT